MSDWRLGQVVVGPRDHQPMVVTNVAREWVDCVWYEGTSVRQQSFKRSTLRHLALGHEDGDEASYCVDNFG